jgi:hypothetical protein
MPSIPGLWDLGPHEPLEVEAVWREFVGSCGGSLVADLIPQPPAFENADFLFPAERVVAELKEVVTEFASLPAFTAGFDELMHRVVAENPLWKPALFGGTEPLPDWFNRDFVRLFRPPISRILKKANRQLRETKAHFGIEESTGLLLFVNDGFTSLGPEPIRALAASLLAHSYSSVDCFVYLTVNRYIEFPGDEVPRLLWAPVYSDRAPQSLPAFVNSLGAAWFAFLESKIDPFTVPNVSVSTDNALLGSRPIIIPSANSG